MPARRNRIQDVPPIELPSRNEVERGDKETYPARYEDGVGSRLSKAGTQGNNAESARSSNVMVNG
jgi:hypothetical protein